MAGTAQRHKKAEKAHQEAVAAWAQQLEQLQLIAQVTRQAAHGDGPPVAGMLLARGEAHLWSGPGSLIEPRRATGHYTGSSSGVSVRIAKGVRYRVGASRGHYVPGPELQTPVDRGTVHVTTRRVLFTGGTKTREWNYDKLVGVESSSDDNVTMLHVSNRQKVSGVSVGKAGDLFQTFFALGVAISRSTPAEIATSAAAALDEHRRNPPT